MREHFNHQNDLPCSFGAFYFSGPAVFGFNMNVFLRSREMFRCAAILGRFASLQQIQIQIHKSSIPCLLHCGRTLRCSTFNTVRHFCRHEMHPLSSNRQVEDLSLEVPDIKTDLRDSFFREVKECRAPSDVLDLVDRCSVASWCISSSLTRMWHTTKKMSDEQKRWELRLMAEHPTFEKLCHGARMSAPRMHSHNLAFTLLALVKLGVSQSSYVVQTILRVIQVCLFFSFLKQPLFFIIYLQLTQTLFLS